MYFDEAAKLIIDEYHNATNKFNPIVSPHEGIAVIQEEYEELKAEVFKSFETRSRELMIKEAKQLGAMALRFLIDLC